MKPVRAVLIAALAVVLAGCGGGGSSSPPPPGTSNATPTFTSPAAISIRENSSGIIYRPVAVDPEGAPVVYGAAIGGPDAARFVMNAVTREVRFAAPPNFEAPADTNADNVYNISFQASDGINTATQVLTVTVTDTAAGFRVRQLAIGLNAPIYAAGLPDGSGRLVIVERAGRMRLLTPSTGTFAAQDFLDLMGQIRTEGEMGLLAIAFSPNFLVDRTFYLHLNPTSANVTEIRRYQTLSTAYDLADPTTANAILTIQQPPGSNFLNHKGGMLAFDAAGRLLIGLGDGGSGGDPLGNAQNSNTLLGKLLRIDVSTDAFPADDTRDYSIPAENPFAAGGGLPEIWAMGLRNPFRGSVDRVTGDVFIGDVGQGDIEEIDRLSNNAGAPNFGWNHREGTQPYLGGLDSPGFTPPVTEYSHGAGPFQGVSVTGGVAYRGPIEDLQGLYLFADFGSHNFWTAPLANLVIGATLPSSSLVNRNTAFAPNAGSLQWIVAFGTDGDGNVYMPDIVGGQLFVLEPLP